MTELLWQPSPERIKGTNMYRFLQQVNQTHGLHLSNYDELYQWSIEHSPDFWAALWEYGEVIHSRPYDKVVDDVHKMPGARWFEGAELNFAENLLRYRDEHIALSFKGEGRPTVSMTYAELYDLVADWPGLCGRWASSPGIEWPGLCPT